MSELEIRTGNAIPLTLLGFLRCPTLTLRIGDPLACIGTEYALLSSCLALCLSYYWTPDELTVREPASRERT